MFPCFSLYSDRNMVVTVGSIEKGGVSKSTIACKLADSEISGKVFWR